VHVVHLVLIYRLHLQNYILNLYFDYSYTIPLILALIITHFYGNVNCYKFFIYLIKKETYNSYVSLCSSFLFYIENQTSCIIRAVRLWIGRNASLYSL
jgi:hypothetical protein